MSDDCEKLYAALGAAVRRTRQWQEVTQAELGARVGLSRTSITNLEKGRQRIQVHTLVAIADALGIQPDDLLKAVPVTAPPLQRRAVPRRLAALLSTTRADIDALLEAIRDEP
jgi:transcriptional regulator with XRE-family HTH domain